MTTKKNHLTLHVPLLVLSLIMLQGCSGSSGDDESTGSEPNRLNIQFEVEYVIGEDANTAPEELLGVVNTIKTDDSGYVYITDEQSPLIRVYDNLGKFLRTVGREGDGPGEFTNTPAIEINNSNELVAFSGGNVAVFSREGELLSNTRVNTETLVWPRHNFRQLADGRFVVVRKPRDMENSPDEELNRMHASALHLYDSSFENRLESIADLFSLMETDNDFLRFNMSDNDPGRIWPEEDGSLWFAPSNYEGRLFKFEENAQGWIVTDTLEGHILVEESVTSGEDAEDLENAIVVVTYGADTPSGIKTLRGQINSESLGVFKLNDGRLIHFSNQHLDEETQVLVEVFDIDGKLDGIGSLDGVSFMDSDTYDRGAIMMGKSIQSLWKDSEDLFYIYDGGEESVVRVGRLTGF